MIFFLKSLELKKTIVPLRINNASGMRYFKRKYERELNIF
jgi:hypothetical protein